MPQKDYILHEIEKIGALLNYLIGKYFRAITNKQKKEVVELIDKELIDQLSIHIDNLLKTKKTEFEQNLNINRGFSNENIELLADLLYTIGKDDINIKRNYLLKALELYEFINEKSKTFSIDRQDKILAVEHLLQ